MRVRLSARLQVRPLRSGAPLTAILLSSTFAKHLAPLDGFAGIGFRIEQVSSNLLVANGPAKDILYVGTTS